LVAALFAIHPLHVESVAWVAEHKDVLSGFFCMLTLLAYSHYVRSPGWLAYGVVMVVLALGLLAKPMLVTLPCVLLLLDFWPLRRTASWRWRATEKLPMFLLVVGSCAATWFAQSQHAMGTLESYGVLTRLGNALVSYAAYLVSMVWPVSLTVFYPHPGTNLSSAAVVGAVLLLTAITIACVWGRHRFPYLIVGWLWYLGMLVPVIGLVQVGMQARADRYTYLPLIGIFIAVVWGAADLCERAAVRPVWRGTIAGIVVVACMLLTYRQLGYWANSRALWEHAVHVNPDNATAWHMLGMDHHKASRSLEAIRCFTTASRLDPTAFDSRFMLVGELLRLGRLAEAEEEAMFALTEGTRNRSARGQRVCWTAVAEARRSRKEIAQAIEAYREALRHEDWVPVHANLGTALAQAGRFDEAINHLQIAVRGEPGNAVMAFNLALVFADRQDWPRAVEWLEHASSLADAAGNGELASIIRARLSRVRTNMNHRDTENTGKKG
jgi:Flp pilus assembly protein TadD